MPCLAHRIHPTGWMHQCRKRARYSMCSRPQRRALTLIELLVTLALFVAFMAISYPAVYARFADRQLEESAERVRSLLTLARVESQSTGRPIEVVYLPESREITYRPWSGNQSTSRGWMDEYDSLADATYEDAGFGASSFDTADSDQIIGFDGGTASRASDFDIGGMTDDEDPALNNDASVEAGSDQANRWSVVTLPEAVHLRAGAAMRALDSEMDAFGSTFRGADEPGDFSDDAGSSPRSLTGRAGDEFDSDVGFTTDSAEQPSTLVVFLPDGSALVDARFVLHVREGEQRRVSVNAWSGRVTVSSVDDKSDASMPAEDETPDDESMDEVGGFDPAADDSPGNRP